MINANAEFEMVEEIDKWRFIAFIMLEIQAKKPTLLSKPYLIRKGFDFRRWSLEKTLASLSNFTEVVDAKGVTYLSEVRDETVTQSRVDKSRVEEIDTSVSSVTEVLILMPYGLIFLRK